MTREGAWVRSLQYPLLTGGPLIIRLHPLGSGGFFMPAFTGGRGMAYARISEKGSVDTIPQPPPPDNARKYSVVCRTPDSGMTFISPPEVPMRVVAFEPRSGQMAAAWSEAYRIAFVNSAGDTTRFIEREHVAPAYGDSLWQEAVKPHDELRATFPGAKCEPSTLERPAYRAALRHILFDDESGEMWVEAAIDGGFTWEVFDADGRLIGRMAAPVRAADLPPYVRDGHLYQVETDESDVQYVGVYRIRKHRE